MVKCNLLRHFTLVLLAIAPFWQTQLLKQIYIYSTVKDTGICKKNQKKIIDYNDESFISNLFCHKGSEAGSSS